MPTAYARKILSLSIGPSRSAYRAMSAVNVDADVVRIVVACMPKSGSTYLSRVIEQMPGMRRATLVPGWRRREQELCIHSIHREELKTRRMRAQSLIKLGSQWPAGYVAQNHLRYSEPTADIIATYRLRPVVLVRNIFDIVLSVRDHYRNESNLMAMAYVTQDMRQWPDDKLHHFIADMVVPWYLNFYMTWRDCPDKLLVDYDQATKNTAETMLEIGRFAGAKWTPADIEKAYAAAAGLGTRKNKAVSGRGASLGEDVKDKIRRLAAHYEGVDFSRIGL